MIGLAGALAAPRKRGLLRRPLPSVTTKQLPFLRSASPFRAFVGGRGSGKTYAGCYAALTAAGRGRATGVIVAPTYPMVTDDVLPVFLRLAGPLVRGFNRSDMTVSLLNGSRVLFRSASNAEHVNRLRGLTASWFWLDEAAHIPEGEEAWKILLATLREGGRMGRAWITTTPRGRDWIYNTFVLSGNEDYALFSSHTADNTFVSDEYKAKLTEAYGVGWFARQELAGEFCDPEGALFQRQWFRMVDDAPEFVRTYRGWDLAVTTKSSSDYTVGCKIGVSETQDIYVLDIVRGRWEWPDAKRVIVQTAQADGEAATVCVESVAFQLAAVQELRRESALSQYVVTEIRAERDKLSHALPIASKAQANKVCVVRGAWNSAFLDELSAFSGDGRGHDDQVDALTIAYRGAAKPQVRFRVLE